MRSWTTGEVRMLREAWGRVPAKQLADEMGTTVHALEQYAHRLGLRRTAFPLGCPWAEHEDRALRMMAARGCADEEISDALGRGVRSVKRRRAQIGV